MYPDTAQSHYSKLIPGLTAVLLHIPVVLHYPVACCRATTCSVLTGGCSCAPGSLLCRWVRTVVEYVGGPVRDDGKIR